MNEQLIFQLFMIYLIGYNLFSIGRSLYLGNKLEIFEDSRSLLLNIIFTTIIAAVIAITFYLSNLWVYVAGVLFIISLLVYKRGTGLTKTHYFVTSTRSARYEKVRKYPLEEINSFELVEKEKILFVVFVEDTYRELMQFHPKDKERIIELLEPYAPIEFKDEINRGIIE